MEPFFGIYLIYDKRLLNNQSVHPLEGIMPTIGERIPSASHAPGTGFAKTTMGSYIVAAVLPLLGAPPLSASQVKFVAEVADTKDTLITGVGRQIDKTLKDCGVTDIHQVDFTKPEQVFGVAIKFASSELGSKMLSQISELFTNKSSKKPVEPSFIQRTAGETASAMTFAETSAGAEIVATALHTERPTLTGSTVKQHATDAMAAGDIKADRAMTDRVSQHLGETVTTIEPNDVGKVAHAAARLANSDFGAKMISQISGLFGAPIPAETIKNTAKQAIDIVEQVIKRV